MANQKTPTSLLLTPEGGFHSFGYTARDYYHDLDPEEARDWLYFEKFKMKIHSTSVRLRPCAPAKRGAPGGGSRNLGGCKTNLGVSASRVRPARLSRILHFAI